VEDRATQDAEVLNTETTETSPAVASGKGAEKMRIYHSPETDSLSIKLLTGPEGVSGEVMGEDLNENVVLHRDAGKLYEIEVVGNASEVIDLSRLYVEGLPVGVFPAPRQESPSELTER